MRILFVTNMYPVEDYIYYGIHVKEQIDLLKSRHGIEPDVYFIDGRKRKLNYLRSVRELKHRLKHNKYDLIHVHYGISGLFQLFFTPKVPVVITLHSGELFGQKGYVNRFLQRRLTLSIIRGAQKIIVLNDETMGLLRRHGNKLVKLPCGTDIDYFRESGSARQGTKFLIGFPGNKARPEKNYPLFHEIMDRLKGEMEIEVVEFHNMKREEVVRRLSEIDLLLMTSTVEGSPQIIKEAMACNCSVISTAAGDVEDLLSGVENCAVVHSFDASEFLAPIRKLHNLSRAQRKSNGREKLVAMGLNADSVAGNLYSLYTALV